MKLIYYKKGLLIFGLLALIFSVAGCGDTEINSKWKTQNITIDGNDADWGNTLTYVDDIKSLVGVENDNNFLYLCLVTTDNTLESKMLRMGLTVWFDRTASDDKKFGIRFPLGFRGMDRSQFQKERTANMEGTRPNPTEINERLLNNQTDAEIVGANNEANRIPLTGLKGIELKLGMKDGRLVYEMKIPLQHKPGFNYAISADTGSAISIGLETGSFTANRSGQGGEFRRSSGGEGDDGGFGGQPGGEGDNLGGEGGGMRGGRGGRADGYGRGGGRQFGRSALEPLSFWAKVNLAAEK